MALSAVTQALANLPSPMQINIQCGKFKYICLELYIAITQTLTGIQKHLFHWTFTAATLLYKLDINYWL